MKRKKLITRASLDADLAIIICELRGIVALIERWNNNHTDIEPMDCESEKLALRAAETAMAEADMKKREPLIGRLVELVKKSCDERDENGVLIDGGATDGR